MYRFSNFQASRFGYLVLVLFLLNLHPVVPLAAQTDIPHADEEWEPVEDAPPQMAYQPPADADEIRDFAPPDAEVKTLTAELDAKAAITFDETKNNLVLIGNDQVGVFVEEKTFSEGVSLEFTETEVPKPVTLPSGEDVKIPPPPITATNTISNPVGSQDLVRFHLDIVTTAKAELVPAFEKPVRIVLDLRSLTKDLNPVYSEFYLAYQDEKDPNTWYEAPIKIYDDDGLLSADVMHFSNWAAGVRPQRWNPSWSPPGVSEFSGAAIYSYPIEVPPGRNGLQPNVTLSYSSRGLDGRIRDGESGPIGDGWSLSEIRIVRVGVELQFNGANYFTYHADKFRMTLNGTGYEIYPSGTPGVWVVKDAPGIRVTRHYDSTLSTDGLYWVVTTADGTQYRLGYTTDSEEWQSVPNGGYIQIVGHPGHTNNSRSAIAWNVDTVTDVFGNQMTYSYHTRLLTESIGYWNINNNPPNWATFLLTTQTSRINTIKYNYPTRATTPVTHDVDQLTTVPGSRIEFRPSNMINSDFQFLVNSIFIYHANSTLPITEYRIETQGRLENSPGCMNLDVQPNLPRQSHTRVVNSIQRYVNTDGDATTNDAGHALPATTFSYTAFRHYGSASNSCFSFHYLTGYQNGYGGSVSFTYTSDNRSFGTYEYNGYNDYDWPTIGYNYTVSSVSTSDGRNASVLTSYTYTQPCYGQWAGPPSGAVTCATADSPQYGNIVGYRTTTKTNYDYDGTTALNRQITTFSQASGTTIGRPEQVDLYAGTTTLMSRTNHYYEAEDIGGVANMFTYTSQTTTRNYSIGYGTPDISTKTEYQYIPANQGGVQYGNLTHIKEYDDINAATHYRETRLSYYPNTTNWIVGSVGVEGVYDSAGNLQSGTWYHYDGSNGNASTPPSKGALTRLSKFVPIACSAVPGGGGSGCVNARQTIDTYFTYDVYGNLKTTTTYPGYGYRTFTSSFGLIQESPPTTLPRTTTITYDETGYNLYPVQVSNPLGHLTKFEIYGFKDINGTLVAVDGFQKQPGLLKAVIDPNTITTKYEYDPFGRLHAVYDAYSSSGFGDTDPWNGNPLTRYRYQDNSWNNGSTIYLDPAGNAPFMISTQQRPETWPNPAVSNAGFAYIDQVFFDGFGRPIQTRSLYHAVEDQALRREIITSTAYNAQGLASCQTAPYDVAMSFDRGVVWPASPFVTTPCTSLARTTTTYDGLGRPLTVTAPDGSITENLYAVTNSITVDGFSKLSRVQTRDANGHLTNQFTNSRGQLVLVRNNTGSAWGSYLTYLDTQYYYDLQGNLEMVQQRDPNDSGTGTLHMTTTMTYDNFGRKTGMVDPDMGSWTYQYNAVGSLISQKDARGNQLCFGYDKLDRLLNRTLDNDPANACPATPPTSGSNHLATYTYDTATNIGGGPITGVGLPATVSWGPTPTQNMDTFYYDTWGRLTKQTRLIDNRSYAMETTSFDPLHRPLTIKYPTNEIVTLTYDHEGEQTLKAGPTDTLVSDIKYNDRGQLVLFDRGGSAPSTTFLYHPQTDAAGNGLGDSSFRLKTIQHGAAGTTNAFPDFTYEYDKVGNITKMSALSTAGTDTQTFTYDHLNRLLTGVATGGVANYTHNTASTDFEYDKLGNITYFGNNTLYNYVTRHSGCGAQPAHAQPHAVKQIGGNYYCYDANGNMTTRIEGTTTYTQVFDVENRLVSVTPNGGGTTSFAYDANGIQVKTTRPTGSIVYTPFPNFEEEFRPGGQASLVAPDGVMAAPALIERENSANWLASLNLGTLPLMTARTRLVLFLVLACLTLVCLLILARRPLSFHHRQLAWRLFTGLFALTVFIFLLSLAQTVRAANDKGRDAQTEQLGPVGSPWVSADIGTVGVTGSADETSGTFTIEGGGANIGGTEDAFHFVYQTLYGDGSITANVASLSGGGTTPRAGLMMRDGLADDAAHVSAVVQGNRIRLLDRASAGGNTTDALGHNQGAPEWIRIERSGSTFTLSRSNDGSSWAVMDTRTISMGTMIYIGMAVTGNSTTTLATGVFDNVATTGSGATPTPTATNTPLPTNTPTATNTPVPTNTPTPTNTPAPSATPAPDVWIKRSSYGIAGQMVAVRVTGDPANSGLFYVLSDHLGSTSLLVNSSGGTVTGSTTRYLPFGGYRGTAPSQSITDRDFTGQKENMELGLLYYQARFYVPGIGRFLSADTIVPNPGNPQSFNRYSYVQNSPTNRIDPTGHKDCALLGDASDIQGCLNPPPPQPETKAGKPSLIKEATPFDTLPFDLFDENGDPIYDGSRVQGFGDTTLSSTRRDYSLFGYLHPGIDIPMETGTELLALGDGTVWCAGGGETYCGQTSKSGGFGIGIRYPSCSCIVYYVHAVDVTLKVEDPVVADQVVAASGAGSDGYAHLHLEIRSVRNDMVYNPIHFFQQDTWNSINLQYQSYQNSYANPETRIYAIMMQTGFDYWNWEGSHPFVFVK